MTATAIGDFTLDRWRMFTDKLDYQRDPCICTNGIGCVTIPVEMW